MEYNIELWVLGGAFSIIVALITAYFGLKSKHHEQAFEFLKVRLEDSRNYREDIVSLRNDIKEEFKSISEKLEGLSNWQVTFQIELLNVKKDIELLSTEVSTLKSIYNPINHGKDFYRPKGPSVGEG